MCGRTFARPQLNTGEHARLKVGRASKQRSNTGASGEYRIMNGRINLSRRVLRNHRLKRSKPKTGGADQNQNPTSVRQAIWHRTDQNSNLHLRESNVGGLSEWSFTDADTVRPRKCVVLGRLPSCGGRRQRKF